MSVRVRLALTAVLGLLLRYAGGVIVTALLQVWVCLLRRRSDLAAVLWARS